MESQTRRGKGKGRNRPETTTPLRNSQSNSSQNWSNSGQNRCNSRQTNYSGRPTRFDGRTQEVKGSDCVRRSNTNSVQELPISGIKTLEISKVKRRLPMNRPDPGGGSTSRMIRIFTNHFLVKFDPDLTIYHYDVSIEPKLQLKSNSNFGISKADAQMIKNKVISDNLSRFPSKVNSAIAYDGKKNIYSAVPLPAGRYSVTISKGDDCKPKDYIFTIKLLKPLGLNKLESYFTDKSSEKTVPREILQAMDLVMKEHPSHCRIPIGRSFYSRTTSDRDCDLGWGVVALRGFHQSLKPTDQGLGLVVDSIVNPFLRPISILAFLRENLGILLEENSTMNYKQRKAVETALIGLKVKVNHRKTGQKYLIRGLTRLITKDLSFEIDSLGKENLKKNTSIGNYFREKYDKEIKFKLLPCLDLGKKSRINYVPMEFCELVEGQRFPKELLRRDSTLRLKSLASTKPWIRYSLICQIVSEPDGPCRYIRMDELDCEDCGVTKVSGPLINTRHVCYSR